jgi:hypothetical protein
MGFKNFPCFTLMGSKQIFIRSTSLLWTAKYLASLLIDFTRGDEPLTIDNYTPNGVRRWEEKTSRMQLITFIFFF